MIRKPFWPSVAVAFLCLASSASALSPLFDPQKMMPSSEVERGMRGIGKSVFEGVTITDFNVEVLGVLEKANLGKDLIIVRILDGPVVERQCGVMGGMSGSPVYIDGRLIGAIAYTWHFQREPIAGVTSIDSMLQALDTPEQQATLSPFSTEVERYSSLRGEVEIMGKRISQVRILPADQCRAPFADDHTLVMHRVAPPVYCAGLPPAAMEYLKSVFRPFGIEPIAGPGTMRTPVDTELVPGAAFGALLAWGDFDISTGGTITYRDGDLIIAFGHPFMEMGKVDIPLTTSWVHDFIPCYSRTDKLMSPMKQIGALTQDRPWSVGGKIGPVARSVPGSFKITDLTRNLTQEFHVQVLRQRDLTPEIMASCALSAVSAAYSSGGEGMVTVKMKVTGERGDSISRSDMYYHEGDLYMPAIMNIMQAGMILTQNRFRPQDVTAVEYEASLSSLDNTTALEDVSIDEPIAKAGEQLTVRIRLRPDDGDLIEKTVVLPLPLDLEQGRLRVGVCSGADAMRMRSRLGILPPTFYSLEDMIREFQRAERGDQLFVVASLPGKDVSIQGTKLGSLPAYISSILEMPTRTDILRGGHEISRTEDMPWVIYGASTLTLDAEDRDGNRGKGPSGRAGPPEEESAPRGRWSPARDPAAGLWWAASGFRPPGPRRLAPPSPAGRQPADGDEGDGDEENGKKDDGSDEPDEGTPPSNADKDVDARADQTAETSKDEEDEEDKDEGEDDTKDKVARGPSVWRQTSASDFANGEAKGVAISSDGHVFLTPRFSGPIRFEEGYVWCLAAAGDQAYCGTMNPGRIYRLNGEQRDLVCDTGQFGVSAIIAAGDGVLTVATIPDGRILRVAADGTTSQLCQLGRPIWDLAGDGADGVYAAVANPAAVFHVDPTGQAQEVVQIRQSAATRLLRLGTDLYIGTADSGAVYRLGSDKRLTSVYSPEEGSVTSLAVGPDGGVLVGIGPEGGVVSLASGGRATPLLEVSEGAILSLCTVRGHVWAGSDTEGGIIQITDRDTHATLRKDDGSEVVALCMAQSRVYAACANPAAVIVADLDGAAEGTLESAVFNAGRRSQWGRIDWEATVPRGSRLALRVRSGNSLYPKDKSWSEWSAPLSEPGRDRLPVPPAQFVQYLLEMRRDSGAAAPRLDWVSITYLPANRPPTISSVKPKEGSAIRGKHKLQWEAEDPDDDTLQARILVRPRGRQDFSIIKEGLTEDEYEWDTREMDDGVYDLRVVVDDSLSNPVDFERAQQDIANIIVDNTPPEVEVTNGPAEQPDGCFAITGYVMDANCAVANIAWQEKGGDTWRAVRLDDGLYDWRYERFLIVTPPLKETVTEIIIRARDAAGNVTDKSVKLPNRGEGKGPSPVEKTTPQEKTTPGSESRPKSEAKSEPKPKAESESQSKPRAKQKG